MISNQLKNQHLLWRAGFGPAASSLQQLPSISPQEFYSALKKGSAKKPGYLDATDNYFKGLVKGIQEEGARQQMDKDQAKMLQQQSRKQIRNLNLMWLDEMIYSNAQLREKMAFFWHGHFASRNLNVFYQQHMLDIIRENALGNFRDLLHEVSKSAAMLFFLNAAQNIKNHPNENFARELMELFTMGRGNYTEKDVKEAARAFNGWSANLKGDYIFRKNQHDQGIKTVLSITGKLTGEDVLDILLEQKQTALYITQKIYRFFVNEDIDKAKCEWLADRFYKSNYEIGPLMDDILTSDWFYEAKNIGSRIKSPIELLAGMRRMLPMELENEEIQLLLQRLLGQVLFVPPNVAGWPGGRAWIDSSTLMFRMRLPQLINDGDDLAVRPKADDDQMMGRTDDSELNANKQQATGKAKPVKATIDWEVYTTNFEAVPKEKLVDSMNSSLLQVPATYSVDIIKKYADSRSRDAFIKTATIQIMSTPEYQVC